MCNATKKLPSKLPECCTKNIWYHHPSIDRYVNQNRTKTPSKQNKRIKIAMQTFPKYASRLQLHSKLTLVAGNGVFAMKHLRHMFASIQTATPIHSIHVRYLRHRESHNFRANTNSRHAGVSVSHRAVLTHVHSQGRKSKFIN